MMLISKYVKNQTASEYLKFIKKVENRCVDIWYLFIMRCYDAFLGIRKQNFAAYVWTPNQLYVRSCIKKYKGCNTIFASVLLQHFNAVCIQALASDQHPFLFV